MEIIDNQIKFQLDNRSKTELLQFILEFAKQTSFASDEERNMSWGTYLMKNSIFSFAPLLNKTPKSFLEDFNNAADKTNSILGKLFLHLAHLNKQQEADWSTSALQVFKDIFSENIRYEPSDSVPLSKDTLNKLTEEQVLSIYHTLSQIANKSLSEQSNHAPDMALLFAFTDLYHKHLLPDLNKLPQKLTQFYYEEILSMKKLAPVPDTAHIYIEPAQHIKSDFLEKGIKLYAGRDKNNNVIEFETQDNVQISQATIEKIQTLHFVNKDNKVSLTEGIFQHFHVNEQEELTNRKYFETFGTE